MEPDAMHKQSNLLRALALVLPLSFAAAPVVVEAQGATKPAQAQKKAAKPANMAVVPPDFPADAAQHVQQLNADAAMPDLKQGDKGPAVIRAQVLLDRNWFSVGEIDGNFGSNMKKALAAFQESRNLPATGVVDAATWQALGQQAPAFGTYVLTDKDVAGPYMAIPKDDPEAQSQLPSLGYQTLDEAISERFHMSPKLFAALNKGRPLQAGQPIVVTDVGRSATLSKAASLRIDKSDQMLYMLGADGRVMGAFPVTIGGQEFPLPEGTLQIVAQAKNPDFSYNPEILRNPKSDKKLKLPPGPNNPVGVMWLALSKEHLGIHGTAEPSQMSRAESSGCVRLTNWDVVRLSTVADKGINVEVQA
jgi:lipoprotein-anchoring transpeptidase ErfK/SrfK